MDPFVNPLNSKKQSLINLLVIFILIALFICGCSEGQQKETFPDKKGLVNDFADVLSKEEEKHLDSVLQVVKTKRSTEIVVAVIDSNMARLETFNSYTLRLANAWAVDKANNSGILIGISPTLKRVRITKGLAIRKPIDDTKIQRILRDHMLPELRSGRYYKGTLKAVHQLDAALR